MKLLAALKRQALDQPDFTGKVVAVYTRHEERGGVFEDVKLVSIGFIRFLVGRRIMQNSHQQERWSNVTVWIAIDEITQMCVFDDIGSARRAFEPVES